MGCCGQGRAALRAGVEPARESTASLRAAPARPRQATGPRAVTVLRNVGHGNVRIRGSVSGVLYEFRRGEQASVAASDAPMMVRTGLFVRA